MSKSSVSRGIQPILLGVGILVIALVLVVFLTLPTQQPNNPPIQNQNLPEKIIPRFNSELEIIQKFKEFANQSGNGFSRMMNDAVALPAAAPTASAGESQSAKGSGASNYTTTNIQVQGVDEADIVKTDGEFIYNFYKNNLVITKAFPASDARIVSKLKLENVTPIEMFVNGNKLILFGNKYETYNYSNPYGGDAVVGSRIAYPYYYGYGKTIMRVYDIADRASPQLKKEMEFVGNYSSSRLINNYVYFVIQTYPDYRILAEDAVGIGEVPPSIIPMMKEDGVEKPLAIPTEIGYIPPVYAQNFTTLISMNLDSFESDKETIVGNSETVYASQQNIYLTSTEWNFSPSPLGDPLVKIAPVISSNSLKTTINKFHLNEGKITFVGQGKVNGNILNQFSMDEFNENFRIATTIQGEWNPSTQATSPTKNNVYVLDKEMKALGALEDLAPGESIYSIRFMGEKAYMVTFKKVDPLFVIDLSSPSNPKVVGKLKIPGYSDYLHPLDETHLLGIGKDAVPSKFGDFAWYQGMKIAIFDVSNVEDPKLLHELIVGDRGTDSEALRNHKAFVFDAEKGIMVLPISLHEITEAVKDQYKQYNTQGPEFEFPVYGELVYQGAFVYSVSLENGIKELGRVTHITGEQQLKSGHYYDYESMISRSIIMENGLYTLSPYQMQIHNLSNFELLKAIPFSEISNNFTITHRTEGSFCAGECDHSEIVLTKDGTHYDQYFNENNRVSQWDDPSPINYRNVVEELDWDEFKTLEETFGCPGCADGAIETITISDGSTNKTVRLEQGMDVEEIQTFLQALRNLNGYGGYYYGVQEGIAVPATTTSVPSSAAPAPNV